MVTLTSRPPEKRREIPAKLDPARPVGMSSAAEVDIAGLQRDLSKAIAGEVRFDRGSLGLYATDSSNYRQVPLGVVVPRTTDDVVATHRICRRYGAPIVNRGGGTSLSGETVNFAVVIDHSKYLDHIGEPDPTRRMVVVQPGAINEKVNMRTGKVGLVFGPDPSSHAYCCIGGNLGNNSCGIHSVQSQIYGPGPRTSDNVHDMEVVTYAGDRFRVGVNEEGELEGIIQRGGPKGEIYRKLRDLRDRYAPVIRERFRPVSELPRRVSGFNLDELLPERGFNVARALVGTESTCATALEATLLLTPALLERASVVVGYDDIAQAADDGPEILQWRPIGLEGIDHRLYESARQEQRHLAGLGELASGRAWLLVEFGSDSASEVEDRAARFQDWLVLRKGLPQDRVRRYGGGRGGEATRKLWEVREGGLGTTAFPNEAQDHWPGWEDSAVPPAKLGEYLRALKALYGKYGLVGALYGHLGQGCVHSRISFDLRGAEGVRKYRAFLEEASDLVISYGGSLSGEHGDGQQRAEFLYKQFGRELVGVMREFKRIWDPDWKMNPGKVVDPYRVDEHLKLGTSYNPPRPKARFAYALDHGDFGHATMRCVGVGKCRKPDGVDVMCPSYIVTREEKHTTRGRARLLYEMLQGDVIREGWQSREVYDALDLCLSCKGCTNDCPVKVDMPTYKSEFLYHYFQSPRRNRERYMYAFGFIDQAARLASLAPELVNFAAAAPGLSAIAKRVAGMDPRREIPRFAPMTLQAWFRRRGGAKNPSGRRVVVWPDTFNNHFHTQVGVAAVEALEAAGFRVLMPMGHVCCGRPLYDYGFLGVAGRYLQRTLRQLREEIRQGTPVVGIEPSCLAVFKDELPNMFPHDDDAQRLAKNCFHFSEFFAKEGVALPRLERQAVIWGHCHHKATGGLDPEKELLRGMGMSVTMAKGGCCGLAGSFGFEEGKYDLSMSCADVGLLPAAREAPSDTLLVADGFSCKTQLEQARVGRQALHTAEVIKLAREQPFEVRGPKPERLRARAPAPPLSVRIGRTGAALALGAAVALRMVRALRRRR